jgi:hypothetical protein
MLAMQALGVDGFGQLTAGLFPCGELCHPEASMKISLKPLSYSFFCLPALLLMTGVLHADPIFSENFDEATVGLGVTTAGAFSAINGSNIDVVGGSNFGYLCTGPESGNCVDLGGSGGKNPAGNIELTTALNLAAGTYDLSFDLIGSQRGTTTETTVLFGDYAQTFILASDDDTSGVITDLAVTVSGGPTQLEFIDNSGADNIGSLLDNITITSASTSPVPEPGSMTLLATGLLGAAGIIRRRFVA